MASSKRSRNWVFTCNNYTLLDVVHVTTLADRCTYLAYAKETAASGTPHLQGLFLLKSASTLRSLTKRIPNCHLEAMKGTVAQSITYCSKEAPLTEHGSPPVGSAGEALESKWAAALASAKAGKLDEVPPDMQIRYDRNLQNILTRNLVSPPDAEDVTGIWFYGRAGSGKSRTARSVYPDFYDKQLNKWWDGYKGQKNVILDDFGLEHACLGHYLKRWADRYSFTAEIKGGMVSIRPDKIIVTSQYHFNDIWPDEQTRTALKRRFKVVVFGLDHHLHTAPGTSTDVECRQQD